MDKKTYLPILFTSFNSQNRLDTITIDQSFKQKIIDKIQRIKRNKSSSSRQVNNNLTSFKKIPLFDHTNTFDEYFTIEDKPQQERIAKNVCLGRYINNKEMQSKLVYAKQMTKDNRIVFENKKEKGFSCIGKQYAFQYKPNDRLDSTLLFDSAFECGNLLAAFKCDTTSYQLLVQSDTNTTGYNKWFFFMVNNMRKGYKYTFSIINNLRQNKHYSKGIKIFTYSNKKNAIEKVGWHHSGEDITLIPNHLYQFNKNKKQRLYTLSFTYECEYDKDIIYFANCIPYSYSKIMNELHHYQEAQYPYYNQSTLCQSLNGNDLDYFIINTSSSSNSKDNKEGIVFFARQHPSETVGSWVIQGAMDFLLSNREEAVYLRKHFEILVIPMVNIDGVIAGNTRTSYAGCDLNRKWKRPKKNKHPEIYYIKELIRQFSLKRKIMCLVDFHGHHGAFNSFFYCNYNEADINQARAFPYACAKSSNCINFDQCSFSMMRYKHGAGRINLYKEFGIENACTLETSCFGFDRGKYAFKYINEDILQEIGRDVCMGVLTYHYYKSSSSQLTLSLSLSTTVREALSPVMQELIDGKMNIKEEDFNDTNGDNSDDEDNNDNEMNLIEDDEEENIEVEEDNKNNQMITENKNELTSYKAKTQLPKIKKIRLKVSNENLIQTLPSSFIKTKERLTVNKTEEEKVTADKDYLEEEAKTNKKQNGNLLSLLNGTALIFTPKKFDSSRSINNNIPLTTIIKIKESISSTREKNNRAITIKGKPTISKKLNINLIKINAKKFYSTREAMTQTEDVYFEMKLIYFIGSHKMIGYDAQRERQFNQKRIPLITSINYSNEGEQSDLTKASKSTQTKSKR